ncbi:MAG: hypothetical protein E2P04_00065 [Acidobacteria bacterium]|nr:MAG: hypothetical protein E2P04_00065 [Acidobacteriota bacterium]
MRRGNFVALFRSFKPAMHCYTVDGYEAGPAVKTLRAARLEPERQEDRVYFDEPDGPTVQVSGEWNDYPGSRP